MVNKRRLMGAAIIVTIVAVLVGLETQVGMPSVDRVRTGFGSLGWFALPLFVLFYVAATLVPLPKAVCTIAGGAIFGFWVGVVAVLIGAVAGSTAAFAIARRVGRDTVQRISADRIRELDVQVGRRGFATVFGARLLPVIPFTTINYVFGLTSVTTRSYVAATAIGIVPGTAIYVAVGAFGFSPGSWPFVVAVIGLVILTVVATVNSRRHRSKPGDVTPGAGADAVP